MFSPGEETRYLRQLILPDFGHEAQERIRKKTAFIVGAGGLGSPVSIYMAAAGIGKIVVCDRDNVELSNLNRQILHFTDDIDISKAGSAREKLTKLNPEINIETHHINVDRKVLDDLAGDADIIVDCLDNVPTRLILNSYSHDEMKPLLHAGIDCWTGQMTLIVPGETPCLNCLFEHWEDTGKPKPVLGAVAGVMGTTQALVAIKYLAGLDTGIKNKLLYFDAIHMEWHSVPIAKKENCKVCN